MAERDHQGETSIVENVEQPAAEGVDFGRIGCFAEKAHDGSGVYYVG
jgi:hypothetical protein